MILQQAASAIVAGTLTNGLARWVGGGVAPSGMGDGLTETRGSL